MKASKRQQPRPRNWLELTPTRVAPLTPEKIATQIAMARRLMPEVEEERVREIIAESARAEVWANDRYQVHVMLWSGGPNGSQIAHLSIRRLDRQPARDWRDFQRIKNQLVGPECEAVELYPAESRIVDTANQFHLWCVTDPTYRWPIGFDGGRPIISSESGGGAVQRPHE